MAGGGRGGSEMEVEAGEIVSDGSDMEMPGLSGAGSERNGRSAVEDSACSKESDGAANVQIREHGRVAGDGKGEIPQDVLLAAEAALPVNGNGNGVQGECEEGEEESEGEEDDAEGMVEADSDPLVDSEEESSDESSEEDEDVNAADMEKSLINGAEELEKMVQRAKDVDSDEEDGATEPPRTANEVTVSLTDSCLVSGFGEAVFAVLLGNLHWLLRGFGL